MFDHYPWEASNLDKMEIRKAFDDTIVITAHGYDKKFIDDFELKFSQVTGMISSHVRRFIGFKNKLFKLINYSTQHYRICHCMMLYSYTA